MTKEELEKEARDYALEWGDKTDGTYACCRDGYLAGAEPREKRIEELEKKISVLLSCANCSENKGGYICEKEYENKCLTQKIQYIKELQEEIAELNEGMKAKVGSSINCEKAQKNGELCLGYSGDEDEPGEQCKNCIKCECGYYQLRETEKDEQLTKAKELLNEFMRIRKASDEDFEHDYSELIADAEQFLKEV